MREVWCTVREEVQQALVWLVKTVVCGSKEMWISTLSNTEALWLLPCIPEVPLSSMQH